MPLQIIFKKSALFSFFLLSFGAFFFFGVAQAQTAASPTFLITWGTTGSYIPPAYQGKALPTYGSNITASLELISPAGKILDLSQQTIYWYVNDALVGGGVGVQHVTFPPIGEAPNTVDLRVTIPSYNGAYLVHEIDIPMVTPKTVIYAPYPNGEFSENPITLQAIPYFFNIASPAGLSYSWSVNNTAGSNTENPQTAQVTLPEGTQSGTALSISLSVQNANDSTAATAAMSLTYENQL